MAKDTVKQATELIQRIEKDKEARSRLQGQEEQLLQTLKEEFVCETLEEAQDYLEELESEASEKEAELNEQITKIQKRYKL